LEKKAASGIMLTLLLMMLTLIFRIQSVKAESTIILSVYPPTSTAGIGETFTVDITIADVTLENSINGVYGWQFGMSFDPNILMCTEVSEGPFLKTAGDTYLLGPKINNTAGTIVVGDALFPFPATGAIGSGTLANITFKVKSAGQTLLEFDKTLTKLRTWVFPNVVPIEHETRGGYFSNLVIVSRIDIDPNSLNLGSKGQWITAYIQLPECYNAEDIDASTILLNETIQPVLDPKYDFVTNSSEYLIDHDGDGILERMVKFDRAEVELFIRSQGIGWGKVQLTVTGGLVDGTSFEGTDIIFVVYAGAGLRRK